MASSTLAATRARIAQLDFEIGKLQQLMDPLLAEREKCQQALADYKYPILALPAEITSEIFLQFLPSYPERPSVVGPYSPSLLLQICRRWRDVALATPTLWSTMELILESPQYHAGQLDLLKVWLPRSGNCALSIQLECDMDDDEALAIIGQYIEALLCHPSRWQDMEIVIPYEDLLRITGSMPLLRSLTIGPCNWGDGPDKPVPVLFTEAPALKNLVLSRKFNAYAMILPWAQITTLRAEALCLDEAVEILRQTATLEHCTITMYSGDPSTASLIPPLPLRSLTLRYRGHGGSTMAEHMFQLFAALKLKNLAVDELFLGPDPVGTLSRVCPNGYPRGIEIFSVRTSREIYAAAFPLASLSVHEPSV
ncbi:hypothetical protein FB45DRAFT_1058154 [Roridomyces roridus]|uniref:F-box domain-containing protein n=1 Tax=Roridomyces roridus TaxID=1738132 RepID=A0AAD7BXK0_9AGAR|nr:hypothetical protein FB45DRAFT_1058154 [Roridomyces roridus]